MACPAPCCPPSCTTQVVFPDSISISTSNGKLLNTTGITPGTNTVITIGPATYYPAILINTPLPTARGGGCETLPCCPGTIYYTVALFNPSLDPALGDIILSGTFAINIHDECCATIPSTLLQGLVPSSPLADTGVMYPTTATIAFDSCQNLRTITVSSINIVFGDSITVPSPSCCATGCLQPCNVTAITASAATPIPGSGTLKDVLTIGGIILSYDGVGGVNPNWRGGGGYTSCTSSQTLIVPVTLRLYTSPTAQGDYLAGCLRLCVTGMFGLVQLEQTTLYGYDTDGVPQATPITRTLSGNANISFCNGIRKINLATINLTSP